MKTYLDKTDSLTPAVRKIICDKATEYPRSGPYCSATSSGTYLCRRCGLALFRSECQFHSGCGWPAFDDHINGAVKELPDADGLRTEILCARCNGHLGHVFSGEHFTHNNLRHCVNSASMDLVADSEVMDSEEAIVAGGCFWGVDYFFRRLAGVLHTEAGYTGGWLQEPSYEQICEGNTGHYEAVRVLFDPDKIQYTDILKYFLEIHDPTDRNGQGPDRGQQYQSAIFCHDTSQKMSAEAVLRMLQKRGYHTATRVLDAQPFWPAEDHHQNYYGRGDKMPYCHHREPRFG